MGLDNDRISLLSSHSLASLMPIKYWS